MERIEPMDNKSFSSSRFWELVKSDFTLNKSNYLKFLIAAVGCFVALASLLSFNAVANIKNVSEMGVFADHVSGTVEAIKISYSSMLFFAFLILLSLGLTIMGSLTFSNFSSKRQRISSLMLPASMSEKFTMRALLYFVGGTVVLLLGMFIGILIGQFSFGAGSVILDESGKFFNGVEYAGYVVAIFTLLAFFQNAVFTLGSALWPKLSWVKTWIVMTIIQWIIGIIVIIISVSHIDWFSLIQNLDNINPEVLFWCVIIVEVILIAACWICAWLRYRSTQIVQRFMKK